MLSPIDKLVGEVAVGEAHPPPRSPLGDATQNPPTLLTDNKIALKVDTTLDLCARIVGPQAERQNANNNEKGDTSSHDTAP